MRIGLMLRHLGRQAGGTGTYTDMIVRHMLDRDRKNQYVLFYDDESRLNSFGRRDNVEEVVVHSRVKFLWDQCVVPWLAWRRRLDVVFNPKLSVPLLGVCATVFVQHGADWFVVPEQYELLDRMYFSFFAPMFWRKSKRVITVSKDSQHRLSQLMSPETAEKFTTIYHGVDERFSSPPDPGALASLRAKYGIEGPYILYLGQIYPMKNVGRLIQAFGRIQHLVPHKLVIVGKPYLDAERDLAHITELGLEDRVRSVGWVPNEEVPTFYHGADFFAFPSVYEGFGIPIIEAMAAGCPVLTSTQGACPEVAGDAALLVEPKDVDAIASGMLRMAQDAVLRDALRGKGFERARQFTWQKAADETIAVLEAAGGER